MDEKRIREEKETIMDQDVQNLLTCLNTEADKIQDAVKKEDEKLVDEDGDEISLGALAKSAVGVVWAWIKDKFTFDIPKLKLPKLPNISELIGAVVGGMLPPFEGKGSWLWGPLPNRLKVFRQMYDDSQASEIQAGNELGNSMAAFRLATENAGLSSVTTGTTFIDNSLHQDNSQTSGDTLVADLGVDNQEVTVFSAQSKEHLRNR